MKVTEVASPPAAKVKWALFNSKTYATIMYFILSLPLGIVYFTLMVVGIVLSIALTPLFIGIPLFFAVDKLLQGIVKFEQGIIRQILGLPMQSIPINYDKQVQTGQNWFMRMIRAFDGQLFIRNVMLIILKFVSSIVFFTLMVAIMAIGLGLITLPVVHIILLKEIQVDILESGLFQYFNIDWTINQQYIFYSVVGLIVFWLSLRMVNSLMALQRRLMYVDEPYLVGQQQIVEQPIPLSQPISETASQSQSMKPIYADYKL
ncbi:hypothetical protein E0485_08355 [Paenibacillus albiflavus]|uniref:Putative sensor domain-containing protein n=1 Tax=Paenibacillus albiflavus TaxID=2545760 RepID=A0A4R4EIH2_9BACL|nr:sensor domain-containing protein [Paenibacillus albiflavus]TCZ78131.1 hypothetical protein E0485_08355 [Paenibacillus albiflavus]